MSYLLNLNSETIKKLDDFHFKSEGSHKISPQVILATHPEIITDIPELELNVQNVPLVKREFSIDRKPIDILYITSDADIILIETKLLRNPESHRLVVAQVVDYIKSLVKADIAQLMDEMINSKYSAKDFNPDDYFISTLKKNLSAGNFKAVIVGDRIHPNVLEMVDSIQSAPHLSFSIFLVELAPKLHNNDSLILEPRILAQTLEVERSVIKLEISAKGEVEIESQIPDKEGEGSRPIITDTEYLQNLSKPELVKSFQDFWKKWKNIGGDLRFGVVGFSAGITVDGKRKPLQYAYQNKVILLSEKYRKSLDISDKTYDLYIKYFEDKLPKIYDKYIIGNLATVHFDNITPEELTIILNGAFVVVKNEYRIG